MTEGEPSQSKLEDLLVDEEQMNEELLTNLLADYVGIGSDSGSLVPTPAFEELTAKQQIVVVLLAQRARHELEMVESEQLTPTEISEESGIKTGTIYPSVRDLEDEDIAVGNDGSYHIPPYNFTKAKQFIRGDV
ncbi:hypothetical protein [Salinigranum salinum]|uniref:hypothetical protein n=1 Tax=Salinigranum salinum TaxID=1364937 RepID=UPI001260794C|nr:hypothetical protein [Salinigranum salinum]